MTNYEPPPPDRGKYRLVNRMVGPLPPGKYKIDIKQKGVGGKESTTPNTRFIDVTGPQFSIPPFDIHSVYPSRNEQNATTHCYVPFITLGRRTLPWERSAFLPGELPQDFGATLSTIRRDYPWMALLVFTEAELEEKTQIHKSTDGKELKEIFPDSAVRATLGIDPSNDQMIVDAISPNAGDVPKIFPTLDELLLLSHARQVNPMDKENCGDDADGWFSVLISNRVLIPSTTYHACVVSLEGKIAALYEDPGGLMDNWEKFEQDNDTENPSHSSMFPLLHHWTFKSSPEGGDFQSRMERLRSRLKSSATSDKLPGDLIPINLMKSAPTGDMVEPLLLGNESVPGMTANSYLMTEMHGADGLKEDVLYRGPFTSFPENHVPKEAPYQTSDAALALVQELGIWDISHASAVELGRLLALSDARFTKALKNWLGGKVREQQQQRANQEKASRELEKNILAADTLVDIFPEEESSGTGPTLDYLNLNLNQPSIKVEKPPDLSDVYKEIMPDGGGSGGN